MVIDTQKVIDSSYIKGTIREALKITLESTLQDIHAVVDKVKGVYTQGQQLVEVHDQYNFIIPKSSCSYTSATPQNNLIIYSGGSYDAISIDDSKEGILIITGRFNSICVPHIYTITLNSSGESLVETDTFQIVASCTDNSVVVENPTIIYTSSDEAIATVNSAGLVTCFSAGSVTISCNYKNVSVDLAITVEEKTVETVISYNYAFSQSITQLKTYMTTTLTTFKYLDGVVAPTLHIDYSFDANTQALINSGKIVVTRKSDSSISIKNASVSTVTNIYLTVIDTETGTKILDNKAIVLAGM